MSGNPDRNMKNAVYRCVHTLKDIAFSIQSLAANSECPLGHAKFHHPQGPSNTNSKRRNQPIQLPL
jgi:hypothetical protein